MSFKDNPKLLFYFVFLILRPSSTFAYDTEYAASVAIQLTQLKLEYDTLNRRVGFLEIENKDQKEDIQFLKAKPSENNQNDPNMNNLRNQGRRINDAAEMTLQKRPARLFPASLLRGRKMKDEPIIGLPSSCDDLNKMGHTLNAIYMVKGSNGNKINAVFCNFQTIDTRQVSSSPYSTLMENQLGLLDVKSVSGVYFYVQVFGIQPVADDGIILFNKERLNIGGGMNMTLGVFTAPKAGTYAFTFSILKNGYSYESLNVYLRRNGIRIGISVAGVGLVAIPTTQQSILKLEKGDRIDLQKGQGGQLSECSNRNNCHHFSGWLLEEDLQL